MIIAPEKLPRAVAELSSEVTGFDLGLLPPRRPRVAIIGGGFAGLSAARALAKTEADVTLIERRSYHLFQPLLYQVATASLSPTDITAPIHSILGDQANVRIVLGEVSGIDKVRRTVCVAGENFGYDYLVVATGARHSCFGEGGWEAAAPGLKTIEDAAAIRSRIRLALERAQATEDEAERRRLMTFVIIGAGPTGVELASAVAEAVQGVLARDFRRLDSTMARTVLVEAAIRVLPNSSKVLSSIARRSLQGLGVELRLGVPVTDCDADGIVLAGKRLPSATVLWAAGVAGSPAAAWLDAASDRSGRVIVDEDLSLAGHPNIFVVGDTAHVAQDGKPLPGVAPVAKQQGAYVGKVIAACVAHKRVPGPFRCRNRGNLVTIGRKSAVAEFGGVPLSGRLAWLLWSAVHIYSLIGFGNRMAVMLGWIWTYVSSQPGARLTASGRRAAATDRGVALGLPARASSRVSHNEMAIDHGGARADRELVLEH